MYPYPRNAFDPETISILVAALDDAWERIEPHDAASREALAKCIVDAARTGERDRRRLGNSALRRYGSKFS
jgi:hypothetical protein